MCFGGNKTRVMIMMAMLMIVVELTPNRSVTLEL